MYFVIIQSLYIFVQLILMILCFRVRGKCDLYVTIDLSDVDIDTRCREVVLKVRPLTGQFCTINT